MGRGPHKNHKEERVSLSTKMPLSEWLELTEQRPEALENTSKYLKGLIDKDLKKKK